MVESAFVDECQPSQLGIVMAEDQVLQPARHGASGVKMSTKLSKRASKFG